MRNNFVIYAFFLTHVPVFGGAAGNYSTGDIVCSEHCVNSSVCDKNDGRCSGGCAAGWRGDKCKTKCDNGKYGLNCLKTCSKHCRGSRTCDKERGYCGSGCKRGWKGKICRKECIHGKYGFRCKKNCSGYCLNKQPCNKKSGHCDEGCSPGRRGRMCTSRCPAGYYGSGCQQHCSGRCANNVTCVKVDGHCPGGCVSGWRGDKCDADFICQFFKGCNDGSFGVRCTGHCSYYCLDNIVCDKVDGHCPRGCAAGWRDAKCDRECPKDTYGVNCSLNCSGHCLHGAFCNRVTGVCDERCQPGWTGSRCEEECSKDKFGMNCSNDCSGHCVDGETCNKTDGHCDGGCVTGWQGNLCEIAVDSAQAFHGKWPAMGVAIGAVLVLLGVLFFVVVAYRRVYIPSRQNKRHQKPVPVQSSDETAYANRIIASGLNSDQSRHQYAAPLSQDGCEYYNLVERTAPIVKMPEHGILLENLINLLEDENHRPGKLAAEFAKIPTVAEHSCLEARKSSNKHKNRYQQIYPYTTEA